MTTINTSLNVAEEINRLNELFANRYTDEDEEYRKMSNRPNAPPIVDNWDANRQSNRSRQFNNHNQQQQRYHSHHRQYDRNDRRNDRDRSYNRHRSRSPYNRHTHR